MRRRLAVGASLAAVMLVASILVSGSQAMVGGSVPNAAQKAAVTTVTLTGWASSPAETDALKATVAGFERMLEVGEHGVITARRLLRRLECCA